MDPAQASAIYELMMLTAWADGRLEITEALVAEAVVGSVPELLDVPDKGMLAARAKALLEEKGLTAALAQTAAGLRDDEHREIAFVFCARVLEADGIIAQEEFKLLSELKKLFGFSADRIALLMRIA
jgi:uncharacterized tellurite resistance protein B-like protein